MFPPTGNADLNFGGATLDQGCDKRDDDVLIRTFVQSVDDNVDLLEGVHDLLKLGLKFRLARELVLPGIMTVEVFQLPRQDLFLSVELLDQRRDDIFELLVFAILVFVVYKRQSSSLVQGVVGGNRIDDKRPVN